MTGFDLFLAWARVGQDWARLAPRSVEMLAASGAVIDTRSGMLRAAALDPGAAELSELNRMVPEKLKAFGAAGESLIGDWTALQRDMAAQWSDLAAAMVPAATPCTLRQRGERMAGRAVRMAERAAAMPGKALDPIHRTATGNARRLKK